MPMHDVGYRAWKGALTSMAARWWMITQTGIAIAFRSQWIKRMLLAAWMPIVAVGAFVFVFESYLSDRESKMDVLRQMATEFGVDLDDPESRKKYWERIKQERRNRPFMRRTRPGPRSNQDGNRPLVDVIKSSELMDPRWKQNEKLVQKIKDRSSELNVDLAKPHIKKLFRQLEKSKVPLLINEKEFTKFLKEFDNARNREKLESKIDELAKTVEKASKFASSKLEDLDDVDVDELIRQSQLAAPKDRFDFEMRQMDLTDSLPPPFIVPYRERIIAAWANPDNSDARVMGWSYFLMVFLGYPQGVATIILLALIVPPLISRDLRSRAYFIYFARPIGRFEYLFGKFTIPLVFLSLITTLPALGLYVFAVALSPDLSVVFDTWHLPIKIVLASAVMIIPTVSVALMLSSLTQESRFATFALFAIWSLTAGAYIVMWGFHTTNEISNSVRQQERNTTVVDIQDEEGNVVGQTTHHHDIHFEDLKPLNSNWQMISFYHSCQHLQGWIFGLVPFDFSVVGCGFMLLLTTVGSWTVLYWRVSAPIRV